MEIKICERVNGKGVYSTSLYKKGDIVHILNGEIKHIPSKYTIEISKDTHIIDDLGKYINHSFSPNVKVSNTNIIAIRDIKLGEEICYNYNESESVMANPFYCDEQFVSGKKTAKYEYSSRNEFFKAIFFGFALSMIDTYEFRNGFSGGFFQNSASWLTISSPMWSTFLIKRRQNKLNKSRNTIEIDDLKACYYQGYDNVFIKKNTKAVLGCSILGASIVVATKILLE